MIGSNPHIKVNQEVFLCFVLPLCPFLLESISLVAYWTTSAVCFCMILYHQSTLLLLLGGCFSFVFSPDFSEGDPLLWTVNSLPADPTVSCHMHWLTISGLYLSARKQEVIKLTEQLVAAITSGDYDSYT